MTIENETLRAGDADLPNDPNQFLVFNPGEEAEIDKRSYRLSKR